MDNLGISDVPIDKRYWCEQLSDRYNNHTDTCLSFIFASILTLSYLSCNISILRFYFHILNVINYVFHNIMGVWVVQWLRSMTSGHRHNTVKLKWVITISLFEHKPFSTSLVIILVKHPIRTSYRIKYIILIGRLWSMNTNFWKFMSIRLDTYINR